MHRLLIGFVLALLLSSCGIMYKSLRYGKPKIDSEGIFAQDTLPPPAETFQFYTASPQIQLPAPDIWTTDLEADTDVSPEAFLKAKKTASFLVIRNDSILYENYFDGYQRDKPYVVFSLTKSFVSALIGIAIDKGHIQSIDQPLADFIPEFAQDGRRHITIRHVLNMTSGLNRDDHGFIWWMAEIYYTKDLTHYVTNIKQKYPPGEHFAYKSIDTQILGLCLERATNQRVSTLLNDWIWQPLGMEYPAYWNLDSPGGNAKMYGGLMVTPRDLARFGRLYLNGGQWNGKQILPREWVTKTASLDTSDGSWWANELGWWHFTSNRPLGNKDLYAIGFSGQCLYIDPDNNTIIVRTGNSYADMTWGYSLSKMSAWLNKEPARTFPAPRLTHLEGTYLDNNGKQLQLFIREDGRLVAKFDGKKITLLPETDHSFVSFDRWVKTVVDYSGDEVDKIEWWDRNNVAHNFYRQEVSPNTSSAN